MKVILVDTAPPAPESLVRVAAVCTCGRPMATFNGWPLACDHCGAVWLVTALKIAEPATSPFSASGRN